MEYSENRLHLIIDYAKPIEISDLYESIKGLAKIYNRQNNTDCKLYISEIKKGSIDIVFIIGIASQILFIPNSINIITQFYDIIKNILNKLKLKDGAREIPQEDTNNVKSVSPLINTVCKTQSEIKFLLENSSGNFYEKLYLQF